MTIRERIETVLRGHFPDQVPFTIYDWMLSRGEHERGLRNKGLGLSWRTPIVGWEYPNCKINSCPYRDGGAEYIRTTWQTSVGEVYSITRLGAAYGSQKIIDYPIKGRDDYPVLEFIAREARPFPLYDNFLAICSELGNDGYIIGDIGYEPLMEIILNLIGANEIGFQMMDNEDLFWSLHEALSNKMRRAYPIAVNGPAHLIEFNGNVIPEVVGLKRFEKYIVPCYNELGAQLHERDKLLATHLDGNNQLLKYAVAHSAIDVVEAFTPSPTCDMSIKEAREIWPNKILWINFPSSVHIESREVIRQTTKSLLREAAPGDRIIIGITEDIPSDSWISSLNAIADTIEKFGVTPIES